MRCGKVTEFVSGRFESPKSAGVVFGGGLVYGLGVWLFMTYGIFPG
jgi:hypothetical protein